MISSDDYCPTVTGFWQPKMFIDIKFNLAVKIADFGKQISPIHFFHSKLVPLAKTKVDDVQVVPSPKGIGKISRTLQNMYKQCILGRVAIGDLYNAQQFPQN